MAAKANFEFTFGIPILILYVPNRSHVNYKHKQQVERGVSRNQITTLLRQLILDCPACTHALEARTQ